MGGIGGLFGLIVLIADIWALLNIWESGESTGSKLLWTVAVLVFPAAGFIAWLLFGPKK
jgi:hypothetical protein